MFFRRVDKELKNKIESLGKWYYYFNFDGIQVRKDLRRDKTSGFKNWDNYLKQYLPQVKDKRILDIGCNAGIYDLQMAKGGAKEVIGVDINVSQALFVKDYYSRHLNIDFSNITYLRKDVRSESFSSLGAFDFVCMFCVVYHFQERIPFVMEQIAQLTNTVVLQGNLKRFHSEKYARRIGTETASVGGMKSLLQNHGFKDIQVFDSDHYPKPVVIGTKC